MSVYCNVSGERRPGDAPRLFTPDYLAQETLRVHAVGRHGRWSEGFLVSFLEALC